MYYAGIFSLTTEGVVVDVPDVQEIILSLQTFVKNRLHFSV